MLGISLDSFRIAGGIMLFLIALEMVFEKRTQRREERVAKINETPEIEDVSIFPMAMPMIAGPGSIASVMLMMSRTEGLTESLIVMGAMAVILVLTLIALLAAGPLMRLVGQSVEAVVTRLLGVLLAALAVAIRDRRNPREFRWVRVAYPSAELVEPVLLCERGEKAILRQAQDKRGEAGS